jgi:hypothetical protein
MRALGLEPAGNPSPASVAKLQPMKPVSLEPPANELDSEIPDPDFELEPIVEETPKGDSTADGAATPAATLKLDLAADEQRDDEFGLDAASAFEAPSADAAPPPSPSLLDDPDPTPFETPIARSRASQNPDNSDATAFADTAFDHAAVDVDTGEQAPSAASQTQHQPEAQPDRGTNPDLVSASYEVPGDKKSRALRRPLLMAAAVVLFSSVGATVFWTQRQDQPLAALLKQGLTLVGLGSPGAANAGPMLQVDPASQTDPAAPPEEQPTPPAQAAAPEPARRSPEHALNPAITQAAAPRDPGQAVNDTEDAVDNTDDAVDNTDDAVDNTDDASEQAGVDNDKPEADPGKPNGVSPVTSQIPSTIHAPTVLHRINMAMKRATKCHLGGRVTGTSRVKLTFAQDGRVSDVTLGDEPIASAPVGNCVRLHARSVKIKAFTEPPFSVETSITLR